MGRRAWGAVAGTIAVVAMLGFAPQAGAAFGLNSLSATPASTNAGANADLTLSFDVQDPAADLRDLTIHLPPGLIGNPLATTACTEAQLAADSCPAVSDVGDVSNDVTVSVLGFLPVPLTVSGDVYNVTPRPGEPARFGIVLNPLPFDLPVLGEVLLPKIILPSSARLRPEDLGLDTILNNLPNTTTVAGIATNIDIDSVSLTLKGKAGSPAKGFIRLPTSCKTHTVGFDAKAYDNQTASGTATFETSNCGALPFTPELSARIKRVGAVNAPVRLSTTIAQTIEEAGLKRAKVILPAGLGGNNEVLNNQCSQAAFAAGSCPPASIIGSASATSPLQTQGLSGPVALVEPVAPGLPDLGIDLRGALALKLKGTLGFTPQGRNIVAFDNLPDIPISDFTLTFAGGAGGLVIPARDVCSPPPLTFDANFLAHSGATATQSATAKVDCSEAGGGGGSGHGGRKPSAKIKLLHLGSARPTMKLAVKAGSQKLRSTRLKLPHGLRFGDGERFERGATVRAARGKASIAHRGRSLKLKARKPAKSLRAKLAHGALEGAKRLGGHGKLKFKLKVRDADGKTTKLTVLAK